MIRHWCAVYIADDPISERGVIAATSPLTVCLHQSMLGVGDLVERKTERRGRVDKDDTLVSMWGDILRDGRWFCGDQTQGWSTNQGAMKQLHR